MSHQFFLFEDGSGQVLTVTQSELIKLPEAHLDDFLSIELAAHNALAVSAPHTTLCSGLPSQTTTLCVRLEDTEQHVQIFHMPVLKNGTGTWENLEALDKTHTSEVIDILTRTLHSKAVS